MQDIQFDQTKLNDIAVQPVPQVPECILNRASVLSGAEGAAALKLRQRFMRKGYNPVDRHDSDSDEETNEEEGDEAFDEPPPQPADPVKGMSGSLHAPRSLRHTRSLARMTYCTRTRCARLLRSLTRYRTLVQSLD